MERLNLPRWLAPALIILLIAGVVAWQRWSEPKAGPPLHLVCADLRVGCATRLDDRVVTAGIDGDLKALTPFEIWVRARADKVRASFTMEGMNMGFNLYTLRPDPAGVFRARVTLPVCVSGRRDWVMTLEIDGRRLTVPFVTEL